MGANSQVKLGAFLLLSLTVIRTEAGEYRDYAEVVAADPIVETVYEPVTRTLCNRPDSEAQAVERLASTIGEDIRRQRQYWDSEPECHRVTSRKLRKKTVGYEVTYRYRGQLNTRRLAYDPGPRLPVDVSIHPQGY